MRHLMSTTANPNTKRQKIFRIRDRTTTVKRDKNNKRHNKQSQNNQNETLNSHKDSEK